MMLYHNNTCTHRAAQLGLLLLAILIGLVSLAPAATAKDKDDKKRNRGIYERDDNEVHFMKRMSDSKALLGQMGQVGASDAAHPELRDFCARLERNNQRDMDRYKDWLSDWYDVRYRPEVNGEAFSRLQEIRSLPRDEFESRLLRMMIRTFDDARDDARNTMGSLRHGPLVDEAQDIVRSSGENIRQLRAWLHDWYRIDDEHRRDDRQRYGYYPERRSYDRYDSNRGYNYNTYSW